ncbi:MAG: YHS domain-containing protein [Desulfurococcales archaeon]|nr:YHS domain-containing protein [Desulfurococcales archaeon]
MSEKVMDPVCGMMVDPSTAQYKTLYKGRVYYFCSPQCKKAFESNPDFYLEHGPQGMPGDGGHGHGHGHHHHHGHHGHGGHGCGHH